MPLDKPAADIASSSSYKSTRRGFAAGSNAAPVKRAARPRQQFCYRQMDAHSGKNWTGNDYYGQQVYSGYYQEYECDQMYEEDSLSLENVILDWEPCSAVDSSVTALSSQHDTTSSSIPDYTDPGPPYTPPIDSWDRWDCTNEQLRDATRLLQLKDYLANPPAREEETLQAWGSAVTNASFDETQLESEEEEKKDVNAEKNP